MSDLLGLYFGIGLGWLVFSIIFFNVCHSDQKRRPSEPNKRAERFMAFVVLSTPVWPVMVVLIGMLSTRKLFLNIFNALLEKE
jgi:ABC-type antimicrobial peptide transport system permease subunit